MKTHVIMESHDGYAPHSHEIRTDHQGVGMDPEIISREAARERDERKIRAGTRLTEDLRTAQRHYEEELAEADRMYRVRLGE